MLRTHAHEAPDVEHVLKQVMLVDRCTSLAGNNETCQHRDGCCLSRPILTKKCEDLSLEHLNIDAFDSLEAVLEGLLKSTDLQDLSLLSQLIDFRTDWLIVLSLEVFNFEILISCFVCYNLRSPAASLLAAAPEGGLAAEVPALAATVYSRQYLVHVQADHDVKRYGDSQAD